MQKLMIKSGRNYRQATRAEIAEAHAVLVLAHNHPSGVAEPSQADELITQRLKAVLAMIEVRVLDHLIIAGTRHVSFAERGLL